MRWLVRVGAVVAAFALGWLVRDTFDFDVMELIQRADRLAAHNHLEAYLAVLERAAGSACLTAQDIRAAAGDLPIADAPEALASETGADGPDIAAAIRVEIDPPMPFGKTGGTLFAFDAAGCWRPDVR